MNTVNAVQLFILVWSFTAVCRADDDISVSCKDVTGTVGEEVTFSCSVSLKKCNCCIESYTFYYIKNNTNSEIYREKFPPDSCEQRNSFTHRFSSTTVMTGQFRFFVQTTRGTKDIEFTVNITETSEPVTEDRVQDPHIDTTMDPNNDFGYKSTVIAVVVSCFILIIIIMTIIYKKKLIYSKPCGFLRRIFQGHRHNDDSNFHEQNPENVI